MRLAALFKQSSIYFVGDFFRRGVGFLMIPLYTHYLSPADYGLIELVELFVTVATVTFGIMAISDSAVRIYHEYTQPFDRASVIRTALTVVAVASFLVAAVAVMLAGPLSLAVFRTAEYTSLVRAAFFVMFFGNLLETLLVYQRIRERAVFFVTFSLLQLAATLGLNIYFIAFAGLGVWGFMLSKIICTTLSVLLLLVLLRKELVGRFSWDVFRKMAAFGTPLIFSGLSIFIVHFSDRFFLSHFATLAAVGVYSLAYKFGFLVTYMVGQPFGSMWGVNLYAHVSEPKWKEQFGRVLSYLVFFLVLAALALSVASREVLSIMAPPSFASAALLVPIIALGYAFREVGDFFRGILFINKRSAIFGKITAACAVLNLALNGYLISRHGAAGAAWATLLTWLAYMASCWVAARREHRIPYPVRSFALLAGLAVAVYLLGTLLPAVSLFWRSAIDGMLVVLFVGLAWVTGYFPPKERAMIRSHWRVGRQALDRGGQTVSVNADVTVSR